MAVFVYVDAFMTNKDTIQEPELYPTFEQQLRRDGYNFSPQFHIGNTKVDYWAIKNRRECLIEVKLSFNKGRHHSIDQILGYGRRYGNQSDLFVAAPGNTLTCDIEKAYLDAGVSVYPFDVNWDEIQKLHELSVLRRGYQCSVGFAPFFAELGRPELAQSLTEFMETHYSTEILDWAAKWKVGAFEFNGYLMNDLPLLHLSSADTERLRRTLLDAVVSINQGVPLPAPKQGKQLALKDRK